MVDLAESLSSVAKIVNPRSTIAENQLQGSKALSFPPQIDGVVPNFFEIRFVTYDRNVTLQKATESPNSFTIFLPVPENISDDTYLKYEEYEGFGGLDKLLQNGTASDFAIQQSMNGGLQALALSGVRYLPEAISDAVASKLGSTAGNLGKRIGQTAGSQLGALVNPDLAVEFRGVERKNYNFNWKLIATSADESAIIDKIVDCIRFNSLPDKVSGDWILTYPNIAFLKFHGVNSQGNHLLVQFSTQGTIVSNFSVKYNGSSPHQAFYQGTGAPIEVEISIEFQDRGIITRDQIDQGFKS